MTLTAVIASTFVVSTSSQGTLAGTEGRSEGRPSVGAATGSVSSTGEALLISLVCFTS